MEVLSSSKIEGSPSYFSIRMVLQRYRHAKILLDERQIVSLGTAVDDLLVSTSEQNDDQSSKSAGVMAYVSFGKTANQAKVEEAARTLLNMPILTLGAWGDGLASNSILQLSADHFQERQKLKNSSCISGTTTTTTTTTTDDLSNLSLLIVPQANLTAQVKKLGKSIQYRNQVEKSQGEVLYGYFCHTVERLLLEHYETVVNGPSQSSTTSSSTPPLQSNSRPIPKKLDPAIPPSLLFRQDDTYGSFQEVEEEDKGDDNNNTNKSLLGLPLTYANGEPLTKSASKKLQKIYQTHAVKHANYLKSRGEEAKEQSPPEENPGGDDVDQVKDLPIIPSGDVAAGTPGVEQQVVGSISSQVDKVEAKCQLQGLDPSFLQLVMGSFGKRQGIEFQSDMGPFCHIADIP